MDNITINTEFTSLQDMAYQQAKTGDMLANMASYAKTNIAGFPETITDEGKVALYDGYKQRHNEITEKKQYVRVGDNYILDNTDATNKIKEKIIISVAYAFSFSQQQFGQLKNSDVQLHGIIKLLRDATNTYCSNRLTDLKRYAKNRVATTRPQAKEFDTWLKENFSIVKARAKTAIARGEVIDEKQLAKAIVEFNVVWNHDCK